MSGEPADSTAVPEIVISRKELNRTRRQQLELLQPPQQFWREKRHYVCAFRESMVTEWCCSER